MNQSDIRGLARHWWTRADIDILRHDVHLSDVAVAAVFLGYLCNHCLAPFFFS